MKRVCILCTVVMLLSCVLSFAQDQPKLSKYIWIEHSTMNSGKWQAYESVIRQYREAALATNNPDTAWLASTQITGNGHQITFVSFADSLGDLEKEFDAFDKIGQSIAMKNARFSNEVAESESDVSSVLAKYREDLSYNPNKVDVAHTTKLRVTTYILKPGTMREFTDAVKERLDLYKKGNLDVHFRVYEVLGGTPGPALLVVTPLKSLADLDQDMTQAMSAIITPPLQQHFDQITQKCVTHAETNFVAINPGYSNPPKELVAANPDFWTVKSPNAPQVASKGKKTKKGAAEPAAMTEKTNK